MGCDTYRHPLMFRKDGALTIQPRKVTYDLDGNAEIDKSDPEVKMQIEIIIFEPTLSSRDSPILIMLARKTNVIVKNCPVRGTENLY